MVEQRIEELAQLRAGRTALDDLAGNALLWQMAGLAYQPLNQVHATALQGSWRTAQSNGLRNWIFRLPGKLTRLARKHYVPLLRGEPVRPILLRAIRTIGGSGGHP